MKTIFIFLSFLFFVHSAPCQEVPPHWEMLTFHSTHFDLILRKEDQHTASIYIDSLERSRLRLSKVFSSIPERLIVLIADRTDQTNGYATQIPYPHIVLYPVIPSAADSLGDYHHWLDELITHELTHIITFQTIEAPMTWLKPVFGNILSPNLTLPNWWKEGIAVDMETRLSLGGRNRSPMQDAAIRAMVLDHSLNDFDIARANENLPIYPGGNAPYLFGSIFWAESLSPHGPTAAQNIFARHGGRIPYLINGPATEELGQDYETLYIKALEKVTQKTNSQILELQKVPTTSAIQFANDCRTSSGPSIHSNGNLLGFFCTNENGQKSIRVFERKPQAKNFLERTEVNLGLPTEDENPLPDKDAPMGASMSRIAWHPTKFQFAFDKIDNVNSFERYSDLWIYRLDSQKTEQITTAERAREPSFSPQGDTLTYVKLSANQTQLATIHLESKTKTILFTPAPGERISYPVFMNAQNILFSYKKLDGTEALYQIDINRPQQITKIFVNHESMRFPLISDHGKHLYFTSTQNGIRNIYQTELESSKITIKAQSHLLTGANSFSIDPLTNDIYLTQITGTGPQVRLLPATDAARAPDILPKLSQSLLSQNYPALTTNDDHRDGATAFSVSEGIELKTLWPQYWIPFLATSSNQSGNSLIAMTSGHDPLHRHEYNATITFDSMTSQNAYLIDYTNRSTPHSAKVLVSRDISPLGTSGAYTLSDQFSLSVAPNSFNWCRFCGWSTGIHHIRTESGNNTVMRVGPSLFLSYADFSKTIFQISPENGKSAYAGLQYFLPGTNQLSHSRLNIGGSYFYSNKLPKHHALALRWSSQIVPESLASAYGSATSSQFLDYDPTGVAFVMRGYSAGAFLGKTLNNLNSEYRFPISSPYMGKGTLPAFLHRITGALILDSISLDGHYWNNENKSYQSTNTKTFFSTLGAELRIETTVGYFLPLQFSLGVYSPQNQSLNWGISMMIDQKLF